MEKLQKHLYPYSVVPVVDTKAKSVCDAILVELKKVGLNPSDIVAASFDGAANFSGNKKGVQALPNMVYVHCRSHLLQIALLRASETVTTCLDGP